jgi:hypothetical protein
LRVTGWCYQNAEEDTSNRDHFKHLHEQSIMQKNRKDERTKAALKEREQVFFECCLVVFVVESFLTLQRHSVSLFEQQTMAACTFRPKIRTAPKLAAAPKPFSDVQGAKLNGNQVKGSKKPHGSNHPSMAVPVPVNASGATHGAAGQTFKFNGVSYSEMPLGDSNTFALVAEGPSSAMSFVLSGTGPTQPDTKRSTPPIVVTSLAPSSASQGMYEQSLSVVSFFLSSFLISPAFMSILTYINLFGFTVIAVQMAESYP